MTIEPFIFSCWGEQMVGMNGVALQVGQPDYGTLYVGAHYAPRRHPLPVTAPMTTPSALASS